jgi:hypothetical protein
MVGISPCQLLRERKYAPVSLGSSLLLRHTSKSLCDYPSGILDAGGPAVTGHRGSIFMKRVGRRAGAAVRVISKRPVNVALVGTHLYPSLDRSPTHPEVAAHPCTLRCYEFHFQLDLMSLFRSDAQTLPPCRRSREALLGSRACQLSVFGPAFSQGQTCAHGHTT